MSRSRRTNNDVLTLLVALLVCGCAPEGSAPTPKNEQKLSQSKTGKTCCPNCEAARSCAPALVGASERVPLPPAVSTPVYFAPTPLGTPLPLAPAGSFTATPTSYIPPSPVAESVVSSNPTQKRPVGTWEREVGSCRIVLRFEQDRLYGTCTVKDKKDAFTLTMDADYNVTKDNVLYGVITGSEATGREDAEEAVVYVDMPFSARVRQDGDFLTVKGVKFLDRGIKSDDPKDLIVIEGRYKRQPKAPGHGS